MRIGLLGVGHMGRIHINCIGMIPGYEPVGFYELDQAKRSRLAAETGWKAYDSPEALMEDVEVVDIATPTLSHFEWAAKAMELGKHVFIEKPVTQEVSEARELLHLAQREKVKVQVGHVERFNPAWLALQGQLGCPRHVTARRLAPFTPRGADVSVVLDLMIHDLDLILHKIDSPIQQLEATGLKWVGSTDDWAQAHLIFANGCRASLTASRVSAERVREIHWVEDGGFYEMDFLRKQAQTRKPIPGTAGSFSVEQAAAPENNAIQMELETFLECIQGDGEPPVSLREALRTLEVAHSIMQAIGQE